MENESRGKVAIIMASVIMVFIMRVENRSDRNENNNDNIVTGTIITMITTVVIMIQIQ